MPVGGSCGAVGLDLAGRQPLCRKGNVHLVHAGRPPLPFLDVRTVLPAGAAAVPAGRRAVGADCGGLGPGGPAAAVPAAAGGRRPLVPHRRPGRGPRLAVPHGRLSGPDLGPVRHRRHGCRTPRSGRHGRPDTPGPHRRRPCRRRLRPLLAGAASRVRCRRSRPGGQNGIVDAVHVARQRRPLRRPHRGPAASAVAGYGHGPGGVGAARAGSSQMWGGVAGVGRREHRPGHRVSAPRRTDLLAAPPCQPRQPRLAGGPPARLGHVIGVGEPAASWRRTGAGVCGRRLCRRLRWRGVLGEQEGDVVRPVSGPAGVPQQRVGQILQAAPAHAGQ